MPGVIYASLVIIPMYAHIITINNTNYVRKM